VNIEDVSTESVVLLVHGNAAWLGTQEIRFGQKRTKSRNLAFWTKNGIHNFGRNLNEKLPTDRRKMVKSFHIHWHYYNAFTVELKELMPRIIGMRTD